MSDMRGASARVLGKNAWGGSMGLHFQGILAGLFEDAYSDSGSSDCAFKAPNDARVFRLHRFLLHRHSPVFRAMHSGKFREASMTDEPIVLEETTADVLEAAFKFLYGMPWPEQHNISLLLGLWEFGHRFEIRFLEKTAASDVEAHVTISNVDSALNMARTLGSKRYQRRFLRWIGRNLDDFVHHMCSEWPESSDSKSELAQWFQLHVNVEELQQILSHFLVVPWVETSRGNDCDGGKSASDDVSFGGSSIGKGVSRDTSDIDVKEDNELSTAEADSAAEPALAPGSTTRPLELESDGSRDADVDSDAEHYFPPMPWESVELVFDTVCFWVEGNFAERKRHVDALLQEYLMLDALVDHWVDSTMPDECRPLPSVLVRMSSRRGVCNSPVLSQMFAHAAVVLAEEMWIQKEISALEALRADKNMLECKTFSSRY